MFSMQILPRTHFFSRLVQHSRVPLISPRLPALNVIRRHTSNLSNDNSSMPSDVTRPYQVVVAATRDMGIGKDGKLPWNLPSDLRYFKELTSTTTVEGKKNAVVMGRRTWESIPPKYQPLPGRLNVVLTRSGSLGLAAVEDLVVCRDLSSALGLLAEPPHSLSVEKVFVIGGGMILKEALNAPSCEAIHLTDIETSIECDTFIPRIDLSSFHQVKRSSKMVENNIQFSFMTYVRSTEGSQVSTEHNCSSETNESKVPGSRKNAC